MTLHSHYQEVERKLNEILASLAGAVTSVEAHDVIAFIHAGEYGLALETLVDLIVDGQKTISPDVFERIRALAIQMEIADTVVSAALYRCINGE